MEDMSLGHHATKPHLWMVHAPTSPAGGDLSCEPFNPEEGTLTLQVVLQCVEESVNAVWVNSHHRSNHTPYLLALLYL